ncbi:uncharacterized protein PAC_00770 [Phialocephala subalpina]|uniref:Uncharacterized protein n=1 Tax=Phialocephala subalpina TaxID=576137 RepID=A0A1L7WDN1_9HELO|nr:uncharacterized protein PAC_00770 [Phialocephala subalpina]
MIPTTSTGVVTTAISTSYSDGTAVTKYSTVTLTATYFGETFSTLSTAPDISPLAHRQLTPQILPLLALRPFKSTHKGGLASGARAGIAIAIITLFLLALLAIWIVIRRCRSLKNEGRDTLPEFHGRDQHTRYLVPAKKEIGLGKLDVDKKVDKVVVDELSTNHGKKVVSFGPNQREAAHELESPVPSSLTPHRGTSGQGSIPSATQQQTKVVQESSILNTSEEERRVRALQEKIDSVRDERKRLERIQELRDLKEQTKRDMLDAKRYQRGV